MRMANILRKTWRDSSSLIVLANKCRKSFSGGDNSAPFNYDVLLQTRHQGASSFANSIVFPGGVTEAVDASDEWVQLIKSFGYTQQHFDALLNKNTTLSPIFQDDPLNKHISLRISAIRETFEELGLLICSRKQRASTSLWADSISDFDIKLWQKKVSENPEELFNLCAELQCFPDIWSLHYWSNWLTPVHFTKRFDTAFFITAFKEKPSSLTGSKEVANLEWYTPSEILEKERQGEVVAYPPQVYEFLRLATVPDIEKLISFAKERSPFGHELMYSTIIIAKDGWIFLLPGDDLYPESKNYNDDTVVLKDKTIEQLRENCSVIHRIEKTDSEFITRFQNVRPPHHINMGDMVVKVRPY